VSQAPSIECRKDGPYRVTDLEVLRDAQGERIAVEGVVALCRCGGSKKKPFCDGTHKTNGFSGARIAEGSEDRRESYRGRRITIHDNRAICSHAGLCSDKLAAVFKYGNEPWIDPDGAEVEAIVAKDTQRAPSITVTRDGPYAVEGGVRLPDQRPGEGASSEHYTLCRCGGSKNKPFCDGSHSSIGFKG